MSLKELMGRIAEATGPDRELDRDLWEALTGECTHRETRWVYLENDERKLECAACGKDTYGADKWSGLTRSLDAVLALARRLKPGWKRTHTIDDGYCTPALALLAALVAAEMEENTP